MSRKPQSPTETGPAGTDSQPANIAAGKRFSDNETLLRLEAELIAEGIDLANRAIPSEYHADRREYTQEEIAEIIEAEMKNEHPNKRLIGYLNGVDT